MKNDSGTVTAESPEQIVEHITRLMAEVEAMMEGPAADRAGEKMHDLKSRFDELQAKASSAFTDARKKVVAGAKLTDDTIRSHPYESLAIALGIGVVLGALIGRRG